MIGLVGGLKASKEIPGVPPTREFSILTDDLLQEKGIIYTCIVYTIFMKVLQLAQVSEKGITFALVLN